MYYDHFGLKRPPFKITPDTQLFFPGGNRGIALEAIAYAINNGEGIIKVVGEVGSGKTMLCRMLERELPDNVEIVYLANPSLSPDNVLHAIAFELHIPISATEGRLQVMHALHQFLLKKHSENRRVVMFVEEAQSMPIETLEEMRLLSNLETQHDKLLQIVLFGQPELDENLARQEIRQLKERITYSFYLDPFKRDEIRDYINSRLRACGYKGIELFSPNALRSIESYSEGLLRRTNILADKALLAAYAGNAVKVEAKHVHIAASDSEFARKGWPKERTAIAAGALALLVVASFAYFQAGAPRDLSKTSQLERPRSKVSENTSSDNVTKTEPKVLAISQPETSKAPVSSVAADTSPQDSPVAPRTDPQPKQMQGKALRPPTKPADVRGP